MQVYSPGGVSEVNRVSHITRGINIDYELGAPIDLELSQPQNQKTNAPNVINLGYFYFTTTMFFGYIYKLSLSSYQLNS